MSTMQTLMLVSCPLLPTVLMIGTTCAPLVAGRLGIHRFPAVLYLAYVERRLLPLHCLQGGVVGANRLLGGTLELLDALAAHEQAVAERSSSQSASQRIREEQDVAYQRSLAADAKKEAERQRAEQERRQAENRRAQELADRQARRDERLRQLATLLPSEAGEEDGSALRLSLQLLDGRRAIRRFGPEAGLDDLYNWAFTLVGEDLNVAEDAFVIRTMLPPVIFERNGRSLAEAGIQNQMKLIVERKDDADQPPHRCPP